MKELERRRVVITGAGSGLGRAMSLELAQRGCRILAVDVKSDRADATARLIEQAGGTGQSCQCDVADIAQVAAMADKVFSAWGGVDLLVNNAGVTIAGHVGRTSLEDWHWAVATNLWGVIHGCHEFIPRMKAQASGHIVNIASNAGFACLPEMAAYNVSKAGVIGLSETLRVELAPYHIGVTVACPSFFSSNLIESMRYDTEEQYQIARHFFETACLSARDVARAIIKAVRKNRLYALPQIDAKLLWYAKRFFPSFYCHAGGLLYRWGIKKWLMYYRSR
jgi:NAD(P)-dependent dehydrogenase (short-subunit alcohol dehydrogenase family)